MSSTLKIRASGYQGDIDAIAKDKAEKVAQYVRDAMDRAKKSQAPQAGAQVSIADELAKLAKLKEQGVLSEAEFSQMKQELLKRL